MRLRKRRKQSEESAEAFAFRNSTKFICERRLNKPAAFFAEHGAVQSVRAIAAAVGVSKSLVANILQKLSGEMDALDDVGANSLTPSVQFKKREGEESVSISK
jgi:hypothetical protein